MKKQRVAVNLWHLEVANWRTVPHFSVSVQTFDCIFDDSLATLSLYLCVYVCMCVRIIGNYLLQAFKQLATQS